MNINRHLFAAYCGMIKSGYHLMDISDEIVVTVCDWISHEEFDEEILEYFRFARTNQVSVNPYYPRGSDLSAACFFMDKRIDEYVGFLKLCESPETNNPNFIKWIAELPEVLAQIESRETFEHIYHYYCEALKRRFADVVEQMTEIEKTLREKPFYIRIAASFAPNLLQAKFLADYALTGDTLYIISGEFRHSAVVHEYLHIALKPIRWLLLDLVQRQSLEQYVDVQSLSELGYLRGQSVEERAHALEECLVRALCGVIDKTLDVREYCQENIQSGFYSVPQMISRLSAGSWSDMSLEEIVLRAVVE